MTPRRRSRIQIIITVTLSLIIFVIYQIVSNSHFFWSNNAAVNKEQRFLDEIIPNESFRELIKLHKSQPFHGEKLIHLDLKGAPPLISYFKKFFPYIRKLGATGVVIEYEDMFFYKDELEGIRAMNAYQPLEIRKIRELAATNNLIVIPLIQTFGHFEFVLKLDEYKDLREVSEYPQVLCPSHERGLTVIRKMIDQILEAHPEAKYIHIGCDEVLYLGECERCRSAMHEHDWSTAHLFLNHVKSVALYINKTYPGVRPIIWGDMIGKFSKRLIKESDIPSLVDLMVWKYVPNVSEYIKKDLLNMYAEVFKTIWIASAFKGATGPNQKITNVKYHLENHISWMGIVSKWKHLINFKGIVLTGWQRYDHFAALCELLPVGIPSLIISLSYINDSEKGTMEGELLKLLKCGPPFPFSQFTYKYSMRIGQCDFPGFKVYQLVNKFYTLSMKISDHFSVISHEGWISFYNIINKFSSPAYVKQIFEKWPVNEYLAELKELEERLKEALSEIYDEYTVEEWITSYVTPIRIRVEALCTAKDALLTQNVWPRRPLLDNSDSVEKAAREICASDKKLGCALLLT